jgi:hypothetical protein
MDFIAILPESNHRNTELSPTPSEEPRKRQIWESSVDEFIGSLKKEKGNINIG